MTKPEILLHLFEHLDKTGQNDQAGRATQIIIEAIMQASREERIDDPTVWVVAFQCAQDLLYEVSQKWAASTHS